MHLRISLPRPGFTYHFIGADGRVARIPTRPRGGIDYKLPTSTTLGEPANGEWLYYLPSGIPGNFLHRVHTDGSGDEQVLHERVPLLTYTATATGLWFMTQATGPDPYWAIKVLRPGARETKEIVRVGFPPGGNLNLSLSPDGRYAFVTKPDDRGTDLLLVEHFR